MSDKKQDFRYIVPVYKLEIPHKFRCEKYDSMIAILNDNGMHWRCYIPQSVYLCLVFACFSDTLKAKVLLKDFIDDTLIVPPPHDKNIYSHRLDIAGLDDINFDKKTQVFGEFFEYCRSKDESFTYHHGIDMHDGYRYAVFKSHDDLCKARDIQKNYYEREMLD